MPRKGNADLASGPTSDKSQSKIVETAATARLTGKTRRPHMGRRSATSALAPSAKTSEPKTGSEMAATRPTETPNETVRRRILASAKIAFLDIRSREWVVDKDMVDWHDEAIRSVITEYSKDWKESLLPFENWNSYHFGADAKLDHEKYGVRMVPCTAEFIKQVS
jgi:hypothetical protein